MLPAATLSGGFSYLFAAAGCIGGPWHRHAEDDRVCGFGYDGKPTLALPMLTHGVLLAAAAGVFAFGVYPIPLIEAAERAASVFA